MEENTTAHTEQEEHKESEYQHFLDTLPPDFHRHEDGSDEPAVILGIE